MMFGVLAVFIVIQLAAAANDVAKFRIPNSLSLILFALFIIASALYPDPINWAGHITATFAIAIIGVVLFKVRLLGGGDVKFWTATAPWLGMDALLLQTGYVAVSGGLLAILLLGLRKVCAGKLAACPDSGNRSIPRVLQPGQPVPYGVAIAAGTLLTIPAMPFFRGMI